MLALRVLHTLPARAAQVQRRIVAAPVPHEVPQRLRPVVKNRRSTALKDLQLVLQPKLAVPTLIKDDVLRLQAVNREERTLSLESCPYALGTL